MTDALIFLNFFFLGRLFFREIGQPLFGTPPHAKNFWARFLMGFLLVLFITPLSLSLYYFLLYIIFLCLDSLITPKAERQRALWYAFTLLLPFAVSFWQPQWNLLSKNFHLTIVPSLSERFWLVLLGFILTIKEGTIIIRMALNNLRTVPFSEENKETDKEEYERGKWIGILERTFIYFLIIFDQIGAIALIVALKSLARFNELNKRTFAEYFLIGSFLSLLVAAVPAVLVRLLW